LALSLSRSDEDAPAAAEPEFTSLELDEDDPLEAEPCTLVEDELDGVVEPDEDVEPCGHEQFSAGDEVEPETPDCALSVELELVLPLTDGEDVLLDVEGELVLPLALVEPDALPVPEDWLVCAPWFIVEDGLVVVALWFAEAPLDEFTPPEPMFTSGLTFAPAFTSVLLMPTFASTPTLGFTLVLLLDPLAAFGCEAGCELLELEALGCEVEDWLVCADWSVDEDVWAKADPKAPITASAVTLTAKFLNLMLAPWLK
jgi:hypothetical protein